MRTTVLTRRLALLPGPGDLRRAAGALRGPERASAVVAVVDGARVARTLRRDGLRPLLEPDRPGRVADAARARRVSEAVDAGLGLLPLAPTCLRRSVTLLRRLHRLGLDGSLQLGVRTVDGRVEAHAWVRVGDVVVNDDPAEIATYTELAGSRAGELDALLR